MKKLLILILPLSVATYLLAYQIEGSDISYEKDTTLLAPSDRHTKEILLVSNILSNYHYRKTKVNDSLSSVIFDRYLQSLDNNKVYFMASDIEEFEKHRLKIDDYIKKANLEPAFDMFNRFRDLFYSRNEYVIELLKEPFDFSKDESYQSNRELEHWAESNEELNEVWRKIVKDQALSLKLADKDWSEISEILTKRYNTLEKNMSQLKGEDVFQIFMNSFAEAFDPHTSYFSPRTSENFHISMSQSLEGIGARLQMDNDYVKVADVVPGGPAFKSKQINAGDRIVAVAQDEDGEMVDVIGWRLDDVVQLIRGPKGSTVRLQVIPAELGTTGLPISITLVRDKIKLEDQKPTKNVFHWEKDGQGYKLGLITIPSFYMDFEALQKGIKDYNSTTRDVRKLIAELKDENVDGLVIDLRMNGGGSLTEAIELTGLFIPDGPVVQVRNANGSVDIADDPDPSLVYDGPLTVMVNRFSASASEIFSAAIQDYNRGVIIGEQTFGKGTVQNLLGLERFLPNEEEKLGEVKVTLAKFYRVNGSSTQHRGVSPDVDLPSAFSAKEFGESSHSNALPWDQIKSVDYKRFGYINQDVLSTIRQKFEKRLSKNSALKELANEIEEIKEERKKTVISLNEDVRRKEREEAEKSKKARMNLTGVIDHGEIQESTGKEDMKDAYLKEGLNIISDLIEIMNS